MTRDLTKLNFIEGLRQSNFVNIQVADGVLTAVSDDPQIIVKPPEILRPGWYRLSVGLHADVTAFPQVFFDFGNGFAEAFSARLKRQGGENSFSLTFKLPFPTYLLRLDPADHAGSFTLSEFSLESRTGTALLFDLARYAFSAMRASPRDFFQRLPTYVDALQKPYFLRLSDPASRRRTNRSAPYVAWIERHDFDPQRHGDKIRQALAHLDRRPLISVLMPVYNTPEKLLREAIESVVGQIYEEWELCIADDRSTKPHVRKVLEDYVRRDSRIKVVFREQNGHISHATNSAFDLADGEWIALLDHDDLLRPHSLAEVALEIARNPAAQLIYSDEDKIDGRGKRYEPYFKPDFSRELFRSQNYLNHLTVHRADNIRAVGGWRAGYEGSQDYDLNLRIFERLDPRTIRHIPKVLYHWRAVEGSTASSGSEKDYAYGAGFRALEDHVARMKLPAVVEEVRDTPFYRLRFQVPRRLPLVSLVVPTRDKVELLRGCIQSILEKTTYARYEIVIVDNGSVEPKTHAYYAELRGKKNIRVLNYEKPFNYSAINNYAISRTKGTIIGLINNDIEVISPDWLTEMVSWAVRPDVGCVGAKLYYSNDTIQHAGIILGIGGVANHAHLGLMRGSPGYFGRAVVVSNFSAVTGACLLVRKHVYQEVGGLDAENLAVAFNDVDFSLKVRGAGYLNVWTPYAEL